jgi:CheY-like chemotaxis protein
MAQKTVVICDDNVTLVHLLKQLLTKRGFTVYTASDGAEGVDLVRSVKPDLLLVDLQMPEKDGLEMLGELKNGGGKLPYTFIISAHEGKEILSKAGKTGANEVWSKPFNAADLLSRIDGLVTEGLV